MLPDRVEVIDSFPLAQSSKIDERLLLSRAGLQPRQAASTPEE
jgi:non-ribosomal peptide synthetase component E (peptide arylation enzyme)